MAKTMKNYFAVGPEPTQHPSALILPSLPISWEWAHYEYVVSYWAMLKSMQELHEVILHQKCHKAIENFCRTKIVSSVPVNWLVHDRSPLGAQPTHLIMLLDKVISGGEKVLSKCISSLSL